MKKLLATVALVALASSPAFAQYQRRGVPPAYPPAAGYYPGYGAGYGAYGYVPGSDAVVVDGTIVGRDPDPGVRLELRRDWDASER